MTRVCVCEEMWNINICFYLLPTARVTQTVYLILISCGAADQIGPSPPRSEISAVDDAQLDAHIR